PIKINTFQLGRNTNKWEENSGKRTLKYYWKHILHKNIKPEDSASKTSSNKPSMSEEGKVNSKSPISSPENNSADKEQEKTE
ncbi:Hypothetical protein FKW44_004959, partial [Caligus rogercresseyi]